MLNFNFTKDTPLIFLDVDQVIRDYQYRLSDMTEIIDGGQLNVIDISYGDVEEVENMLQYICFKYDAKIVFNTSANINPDNDLALRFRDKNMLAMDRTQFPSFRIMLDPELVKSHNRAEAIKSFYKEQFGVDIEEEHEKFKFLIVDDSWIEYVEDKWTYTHLVPVFGGRLSSTDVTFMDGRLSGKGALLHPLFNCKLPEYR